MTKRGILWRGRRSPGYRKNLKFLRGTTLSWRGKGRQMFRLSNLNTRICRDSIELLMKRGISTYLKFSNCKLIVTTCKEDLMGRLMNMTLWRGSIINYRRSIGMCSLMNITYKLREST